MTQSSDMPSSARHRAREVALQTLFAMDLQRRPRRAHRVDDAHAGLPRDEQHPDAPPPAVPNPTPTSALEVFEGVAEHFEMPEGSRAFAKELVISVSENQSALDERIAEHAHNWRVSRMAAVDRNVLRLAAFELVHTETPIGVVLDEAVELARRFGSEKSPAFVNGILDALAHAVREAES